MNIDIDSNDLIEMLSQRIATLTVELDTTKLALLKTREICNSVSDALAQMIQEAELESADSELGPKSVQIMDQEELQEFASDDSSWWIKNVGD